MTITSQRKTRNNNKITGKTGSSGWAGISSFCLRSNNLIEPHREILELLNNLITILSESKKINANLTRKCT